MHLSTLAISLLSTYATIATASTHENATLVTRAGESITDETPGIYTYDDEHCVGKPLKTLANHLNTGCHNIDPIGLRSYYLRRPGPGWATMEFNIYDAPDCRTERIIGVLGRSKALKSTCVGYRGGGKFVNIRSIRTHIPKEDKGMMTWSCNGLCVQGDGAPPVANGRDDTMDKDAAKPDAGKADHGHYGGWLKE